MINNNPVILVHKITGQFVCEVNEFNELVYSNKRADAMVLDADFVNYTYFEIHDEIKVVDVLPPERSDRHLLLF